jgi:hypothetical protein
MRTPSVAALVAAALLAGCGGGGASAPAGGALPGQGTQQQQVSPQDVATSGTESTFGAVDSSEAAANVGNGTLGSSSTLRSTQALKGFTCRHRRTRIVTVNADGSVTVETIDYYDNACTQVERDAVATYASSGGTATVARTVTTFSLTHQQLGQRKQAYALTGSSTNGTFTVQSAFYPGTSTTPMSQFAHNAILTASTYSGTAARIVNDAKPSINAAYGHQFATNATIGSDQAGDTTYTGTRNGVLDKGALNGLSISSAPPFTISGGTQLGTSALTGTVAFTSDGTLAAVNFTGTLISGNTIVVTSSTDSSGAVSVNGTITSSANQPVATFVTDANGNGVLTLADGTQVPIVDWHVVWS